MDTHSELQARIQAAYALAEQQSSQGGMGYLNHVVIDSKPDPLPFRLVARKWQWERASRIVPALEALAGFRSDYTGPLSYAEIMPRGHDKTSFLGRMCSWLLAFSRKKLRIVVAAGDEDQAGLVFDAMREEAELNPWLMQRLKFSQKKVYGKMGFARVVAADAPSSFGLRADLYLLDEVTHWQDDKFWVSLLSGRAKIPNAVFIILSNAGLLNTWQWDIFQAIKTDPGWCYWEAPGQLETWMSPEQIQRDRLLLPPAEARRLYDNVWIDPAEASGYLTRSDVRACEDLGRTLGLQYTLKGRNGLYYWLSLDYGPKRDRTTLGVYHQEPGGLLVVDRLDVWQGSPEAPIQISRIREWIEAQRQAFPDCSLVADPYQLESVCQEYEQRMPVKRHEARGGKGNYEMAEALRSVIVNRQIAWYPGAGGLPVQGRMETLEDELCSLVLKPMSYGYRFDHEATKHDDRAVNMGMAVVCLLGQMRPPEWVSPTTGQAPKVEAPGHTSVVEELKRLREHKPRLVYGIELSHTQKRR